MKKILVYIIIGFIIISNFTSATILAMSTENYGAISNDESEILVASNANVNEKGNENEGESGVDFWNSAAKWFGGGYSKLDKTYGEDIIKTLEDMVLAVGTTVITLATIFLGIKFMYGSVDSKTDAKEGLINLLVACVFFFGWNSIKTLLFPDNNFIFTNISDTSYENMIGRIFAVATYIAQFVAIIAIIYVGIRYIFAGVQGKTELKEKSGTFIIGIILAFCSTGVLTYISKVINEALAK